MSVPTAIAGSLLEMTVHKLNRPWLFENDAKVSVRLLPQLRVRAAEVGCGGVLADLDDAAADGAGAGEVLEQRLAVIAADRAGELGEILVEGAEHLQHRFLVGQEDVAPPGRIGGDRKS